MSGHSKWATTKRQKAVVDAKRGAIFTKMANLITIAARKGGDPATNFSLRLAIDKAKNFNVPKDTIERAIKRGTGELDGAQIEELTYEGIGPVKAQFIIKCLTDNKNRTASVIRHLFTEAGGSFGAVMWNFALKGIIRITREEVQSKKLESDEAELELIDQGAQEIKNEAEGMTIYTNPSDLPKLKLFLENKAVATDSAEIEYVAKEQQKLTVENKDKIEKFIEELENNEDVADYYTNANI